MSFIERKREGKHVTEKEQPPEKRRRKAAARDYCGLKEFGGVKKREKMEDSSGLLVLYISQRA